MTSSLERSLRSSVERLCAAPRVPESPGHAAARDWIASELAAAGLEIDVHATPVDGVRCNNVHARRPDDPAAGPRIVVGAHYDTVPGTPGADDNASAVAALLEVARHVAACPSPGRRPIELVAYDLEEYGFVGSRIHAAALREAGIEVEMMIGLEMIGFTSPAQGLPPLLAGRRTIGDFIGLAGSEASRRPFEVVEAAFRRDPDLPVETLLLPGAGTVFPEARLSDHASFWDEGYPAMMVTDTSFLRNPHYHLASDRPETLDYAFLARVTAALQRAVGDLLDA